MAERGGVRWLDAEGAARHLSIRLDAFRRMVAAGRLPKPSYALGVRMPRWDAAALDEKMDPSTASTNPRVAVDALAAQIEAEGRSRRHADAR